MFLNNGTDIKFNGIKDGFFCVLLCATYTGFENFVQPADSLLQSTIQKFDPEIQSTLKYQGSDLFVAPFYTYSLIGTALDFGLRYAVNAFAPESKTAKFLDKHYNLTKSAVTYTALGLYEGYQSIQSGVFDWKDMAAYAAGITAFVLLPTYAKDIKSGIKNLFKSNKESVSPGNNAPFANSTVKYGQCNL